MSLCLRALTLDIGNITFTSSSQQINGIDGTVSVPVYSFGTSTTTGMYYDTGDTSIKFSFAGSAKALFSSAGDITATSKFLASAGTSSAPTHTFTTDTTSGLYSVGASSIGITTGSTLRSTISGTSITNTIVTLGPAGLVTAPSYSFSGVNGTGTGLYLPASQTWGLAAGNTLTLSSTNTIITGTVPLRSITGSSSAPAFAFTSSTTTGLYSPSAGNWGLSGSGTLNISGNLTTMSTFVPMQAASASVTLPAYSFSSSTNTGLYLPAAGTWGLSSNGTLVLSANTTVITATIGIGGIAGSATTPPYSFTTSTNTGMYLPAVGSWGLSAGGTLTLSSSATVITAAVALREAAGVVGTPTFSFTTSTNTGMYLPAVGSWGLAAAGVLTLSSTSTVITATQVYNAPAGAVGAPSISFTTSTNTGLYLPAVGSWGLSAAGVLTLSSTSTAITATQVYRGPVGSASAPTFSITGDTNSGMYDIATGNIGISCAATLALDVSATRVLSPIQPYVFFKVNTGSTQSIATGVTTLGTTITIYSEVTRVGFAAPVGGAFTTPVAGTYYIGATIAFDGVSATGLRCINIYAQDGVSSVLYAVASNWSIAASATTNTVLNVSGTIPLAANSTILITVSHSRGSALIIGDVDGTAAIPIMQCMSIRLLV